MGRTVRITPTIGDVLNTTIFTNEMNQNIVLNVILKLNIESKCTKSHITLPLAGQDCSTPHRPPTNLCAPQTHKSQRGRHSPRRQPKTPSCPTSPRRDTYLQEVLLSTPLPPRPLPQPIPSPPQPTPPPPQPTPTQPELHPHATQPTALHALSLHRHLHRPSMLRVSPYQPSLWD